MDKLSTLMMYEICSYLLDDDPTSATVNDLFSLHMVNSRWWHITQVVMWRRLGHDIADLPIAKMAQLRRIIDESGHDFYRVLMYLTTERLIGRGFQTNIIEALSHEIREIDTEEVVRTAHRWWTGFKIFSIIVAIGILYKLFY